VSDRAKSTLGTLSYYAAVATVAVLLFTKAVGAGEILHEIKGLREDLNEIKKTISDDRKDLRNAVNEILADHRKLERRVDVLEALKQIK
tara:strand:- start:386 stop:652 length:267 start_codon:yes stop_codon:yes gene_type:complete